MDQEPDLYTFAFVQTGSLGLGIFDSIVHGKCKVCDCKKYKYNPGPSIMKQVSLSGGVRGMGSHRQCWCGHHISQHY